LRAIALAHDLLMVPAAWFGGFWLRFNLETIPDPFLAQAISIFPLVFSFQAITFWYFGLYRGVWRFASLPDLLRIAKAVLLGAVSIAFVLFLVNRMEGIPRAVFPLYAGLLVGLLGGPRLAYRSLKDRRLSLSDGKKTLVVGAGHGGEMLIRDMMRQNAMEYTPVALVDDSPRKQGREIHGVRVLGTCEDIPRLITRFGIELVLIAIPSATSKQIRYIVGICERANVPFRILPRYQDLVSGLATVESLRNVEIEDLLGREKVTLDWEAIRSDLTGKPVLVTGGGGSIGAELCRQISRLAPSVLVVLEQNEFNLYQIDRELRRDFPQLVVASILGDVGDSAAVEKLLQRYRPEVIFHAAAYKHVPLLEGQARAAIRNNVLGTRTLAELAVQHSVSSFVLISTDKAVNPTNVMGASKRVAEIICQHLYGQARTSFITVRFGNVLGSAGSVVPLFQQQIAAGGPVTVTDPAISRYFMTIPEACQLILQASVIGKGGEIFVLDMGEPVKISYLAEQLIRLSGKQPGEDIEIIYTGLRPGEKLSEELFHRDEKLGQTSHPKILRALSREVDGKSLGTALSHLEQASRQGDEAGMISLLRQLVPELSLGDAKSATVAAEA